MEDGLARDGVLTRCNEDRDASLTDEECANARRASTVLALEAERGRAAELESASEAKMLALSNRDARQAPGEQVLAADSAPAFGAPVGAVMPSTSPSFDVYADGTEPLGRPTLEIVAAEPPANTLEIESPQLVLTDLAIAPRPLRGADAVRQ
jgi:hypothetical protein